MSDAPPRLGDLVIAVPGIDPGHSISRLGELFLLPLYEPLLSLPLVRDGRVAGLISRYQMMQLLFRQFGRELFGRRPVHRFMKQDPVVVEADLPLEAAADQILASMTFPVTEDFIIVRDGRYLGMGTVIGLMQALQRQLSARSRQLARALRDLKASQTQLVQSEKMASLGQMVAGLAHEMNTPLGYVSANVELAEQFFSDARRLNEAVFAFLDLVLAPRVEAEAFDQALARLARLREHHDPAAQAVDVARLFSDTRFGLGEIDKLVRGLQDFSRLDRAGDEAVDIHHCLDAALLLANNLLKDRIHVVRDYAELPPVPCRPSEINQVLLNLIVNAAQAMRTGGVLRLSTGHGDQGVCVRVTDNGPGIPASLLPRIFDPFFTTKAPGEGTGLGLSISHQIIERHGGCIEVRSAPDRGTTFTLTLPAGATARAPTGTDTLSLTRRTP